MKILAQTLIDHFVVHEEDQYRHTLKPDKKLQVFATAVLTFSCSFLDSALAPRVLAAEADHAIPKYENREVFLLSYELQCLLYFSETVQFAQALSVSERNWKTFESLLCCSRYISRSLMRLRTRQCEDEFWDDVVYKVPCVNLEEFDTDKSDFFQIYYDAAREGFKIHLRKLNVVFADPATSYGTHSLTSLLATATHNPERIFSQHGTGWAKTLQVLHLEHCRISDEEFEAFQYCSNLRELFVHTEWDDLTGKAFDVVFQQTHFVSSIKLSHCRLSEVSGIRHLEYLNELSFRTCRLQPEPEADPTCGMSTWNGEGRFPYLEKIEFSDFTAPDHVGSLGFLQNAVPSLIDIQINMYDGIDRMWGETCFTDQVFGYLRGSCSEFLKSVCVEGFDGKLTDEGVASTLKEMKALQSLELTNVTGLSSLETILSQHVVRALAPTLKALSLYCIDQFSVSINKSVLETGLSKLKLLEELELHDASFNDDVCSNTLLDLPNLHKFTARSAEGITSLNFLRPCSNLVELDVEDSDLSDISVLATDLRRLQHIALSSSKITSLEPFRHRKQQQLPERRTREEQQQELEEELPFASIFYMDISHCRSINCDFSPLNDVRIKKLKISLSGEGKPDDNKLESVLRTISRIPALEFVFCDDWDIGKILTKEMFTKYFVSGGKDVMKLSFRFRAPEWLKEVNELRVRNGLGRLRLGY